IRSVLLTTNLAALCSNEFPDPARNWVDVRKKSRSGKSVRTFRAIFAQHGSYAALCVCRLEKGANFHPKKSSVDPLRKKSDRGKARILTKIAHRSLPQII